MTETDLSATTDKSTLLKTWRLMCTARAMTALFEEHKQVTSKYVHATSRGHEAIQLAAAFQLKPQDFVFPYYRDDSILLGIGFTPFDCMLQLLAKRTDPFSGGRTYYGHPSARRDDMPQIPHQSSATGMQTIPATGAAQGLQYREKQGLDTWDEGEAPLVICSLGDGAITEGEIAEALQMAVLHRYPIIYLVQDNEWDISAHSSEIRAMDAPGYAKGFKGLKVKSINGSDFFACLETMQEAVKYVRENRQPMMVHAKVPLLNHHTSGVRKEWYRPEDDMASHIARDPIPLFRSQLLEMGFEAAELDKVDTEVQDMVLADYERAQQEPDPTPEDLATHIFAPTLVTQEKGIREPEGGEKVVMVDAALHAVDEILKAHPEALLYGQDVGGELGGVFREAALLAKRYGDQRVFNTPIMEAYIVGSTVGMSATGCKPIVEVQFADYIWPGLNQLFTEVSRSCYLTDGKWPVQMLLRVPIGAYGSGGPYHSSSVESVVAQIKGVKVAYPSNAADMKGLFKAAFYDPNPVVFFEHKGLYWSKVPGTKEAMTVEPDSDYIIPFGKARIALEADVDKTDKGETLTVITYGMGVYWAMNAAREHFPGQVEVVDLRTLNPLDEEMIYSSVKKHNKCLVLTEETVTHSFAEALAGRISAECFQWLDAPVQTVGAVNTPAIPLNSTLEGAMLPSIGEVREKVRSLLES